MSSIYANVSVGKLRFRLDRLHQSIMTIRCDKILTAREIQLSNFWISNLKYYVQCYEITKEETNEDSVWGDPFVIRWTEIPDHMMKIAIKNFWLPKYVSKRHRGIKSQGGVTTNGKLKKTMKEHGETVSFSTRMNKI